MIQIDNRNFQLTTIVTAFATAAMAMSAAAESGDPAMCGFSAEVLFKEGAPRDRFVINNTAMANWSISDLTLDLSTSDGNLIFDVTAEGAGVEVFQPYRDEDGEANLQEQPEVADGDQIISLAFSQFAQGAAYQFSIDVDDQLTDSELGQIRVSDSEIKGAVMTLGIVNDAGTTSTLSGVFDDSSHAQIQSGDCQN